MKRKKYLLRKLMGSFMAAVVAVTAVPAGTLLGSGNLAYAEIDQKNVDTEQMYVGDFNLYEYRADIYLKEDTICNRIIQNMMNAAFPSQIIVDYLNRETSIENSLAGWKLAHFATSPSEIVKGGMDEKGYYTAIILSVFKAETTNDNYIWDNSKKVVSSANKTFSNVKKWVDESDKIMLEPLSKNQILNTLSVAERTEIQACFEKEFKKNHPALNNSSTFITDINAIFEAVDTLGKAVELMESYIQVMEISDNMKAVLMEMYNQCPDSNFNMKSALSEAALASENLSGAVNATILNTAHKEVGEVIGVLLDEGWEKLIESNPYVSAFKMGADIGTWLGDTICNTLFSTDKTIEQYEKMKCLSEFNDLLRSTLTNMENTYLNNKSTENAANYFAAVDALFSVGDLSCKFASDYAKILYEDSSIGWAAIKRADYNEYMNSVKAIQEYYKDDEKSLTDNYLAELEYDYPEIYKILMGYDESEPVAVTGVKFDYDELTVGLEDTFSIGVKKPIITPKNAANQNVIYTSSNMEILQIDEEGWIIPKNVGTVTVTATSVDGGYTDSIIVNVIEGASGLLSSVDSEIRVSGKCGENLRWTLYKNGILTISGTGQMDTHYENWKDASKVILRYGVTSIDDNAFYLCDGLTEIEIPNSVTSIGRDAFVGCDGLTEIEVPNSVTSIGDGAFRCCDGLTEMEIPNSVTFIGGGAFWGCSNLTEIKIPNSVTSIGDEVFAVCSSLTKIEIPNSVESIGDEAFTYCENLTEIEIPNGVESIGDEAFYRCISLTEIKIPNSVTSIGNEAFWWCSNLTKIELSNSIIFIGDKAFKWCGNLTEIKIPNSVTSIGDETFVGCNSLTKVEIPNSVTSIGDSAFKRCSSLTEIEIPNSVESIGDEVFAECSSLTKVEIPNGVESIGDSAFAECNSLTKVEIPNSVTSIGDSAFAECSSLTEIEIPNGVTSIGSGAFEGCGSLTEIKIPNGVTSIGNNTFTRCSSLTEIEIPNSVTSIGCDAFAECDGLTEIEVPNSVISIGEGAFYGCDGLTEMEISNSVTSIGDEAFEQCISLREIEIPNSVTSIGGRTFWYCKSLREIEIPNSVTSIGDEAFMGCDGLTEIKIPNSVTSIGDSAFKYCYQLHIKGVCGSYAEQYAKSHNIPFQYIHTISSNNDISASYDSEEADISMKLWSKLLGEEDSAYQNINLSNKIVTENILPQDVKFKAYEIILTDESETPIQPEGIMTVKIPVPQGYQGETCKVYYVKNDGSMVNMNAWYEERYLLFETDHFSTYLITETELKEQSSVIYGDINNDGDVNSKDAVLLKKHLAGYEGLTFDKTAADVNADGNVDSKDAVRLLRHLAGYEVILGK